MGAGGEPHALHICGKGGLTGSTRIMPQDLDRSEPAELSYREAVREAIRDALIRDQRVFLILTLANSHRLRGMRNIGSLSMIS